jgi:hypothetical protein
LSLANRRVLVLEYCQLFLLSEPREALKDKI